MQIVRQRHRMSERDLRAGNCNITTRGNIKRGNMWGTVNERADVDAKLPPFFVLRI